MAQCFHTPTRTDRSVDLTTHRGIEAANCPPVMRPIQLYITPPTNSIKEAAQRLLKLVGELVEEMTGFSTNKKHCLSQTDRSKSCKMEVPVPLPVRYLQLKRLKKTNKIHTMIQKLRQVNAVLLWASHLGDKPCGRQSGQTQPNPKP